MELASTVQRPILFHGFPNPKGISSRFWDSKLHSSCRLNLNATRFYTHLHSTKSIPKRIPFRFRLSCQGNDSLGSNDRIGESSQTEATDLKPEKDARGVDNQTDTLEELKDLLHKAVKDLEVARLNSTMFEEKAQRISERAISLKDEAATAWSDVNKTLDVIRDTLDEECLAKDAVQKATMALSLAEARLQVIVESLEAARAGNDIPTVSEQTEQTDHVTDKEDALLAAKNDIKECQVNLANCEAQLSCLQSKKDDLQKEVDKLNEFAETIQINALKAEEDVANIMKLAEQAVAFELEATQRVNDAEIALQRAEKSLSISQTPEETQDQLSDEETPVEDEVLLSVNIEDVSHQAEKESPKDGDLLAAQNTSDLLPDIVGQKTQKLTQPYESSDHENGKPSVESSKVVEADFEKSKINVQTKKQEKDLPKEGSSLNSPKASFNKSSRFFSASFFSSNPDGTVTVFASLVDSVKQQWPKLVLGVALLGAGSV